MTCCASSYLVVTWSPLSTSPWSAKASRVFSGMVFTVFATTRSATYMVSRYSGFFTPVEAHSGRWVAAGGLERLEPGAREELLVGPVGQPRVGHAGQALELGRTAGRVEPLVDLGVHAGDEERRDRVDVVQGDPRGLGLLEPGDVRLHHVLVAAEAEDQRDVDADPGGEHLGDRRRPSVVAGS